MIDSAIFNKLLQFVFFFSESGHRNDSAGYWQIQLDRDLVDTIAAIYPEWVKSQNQQSLVNQSQSVVISQTNHINQSSSRGNMAESVGPPNSGGTSRINNNSQTSPAQQVSSQNQLRTSQSPPKAIVDTSPISNAMEQNKQCE